MCALGRDPGGREGHGGAARHGSTNHDPLNFGGGGMANSDEDEDKDEDKDEEMGAEGGTVEPLPAPSPGPEKQPVSVYNAMKFVD